MQHKWVKVKTHIRDLHRECVTRNCNKQGKVTATLSDKATAMRMDCGPWCVECATEGGVLQLDSQ